MKEEIKMNQNTNIESLIATRTIFIDAIEIFETSQIPGSMMEKVMNCRNHFSNMIFEADNIIDQITKYKAGLSKKAKPKQSTKKVTKKKTTNKKAIKKKSKKGKK